MGNFVFLRFLKQYGKAAVFRNATNLSNVSTMLAPTKKTAPDRSVTVDLYLNRKGAASFWKRLKSSSPHSSRTCWGWR